MSCRQGIIYDLEDDQWLRTGYPGYYVSYMGYVSGPGRYGKSEILKPTPVGSCGHLDVSIHVDGRRVHRYVHRLVAESFIPNPLGYRIVRHLDDDPTNNCADNLAWGTQTDNMRDAIANGNFHYFSDADREIAMQKRRTPVVAVSLTTGRKINYRSQQEAARALNTTQGAISSVLRGKSTNANGYFFMYTNNEEYFDIASHRHSRHGSLIKATNIETDEQLIFKGQTNAARELGMSVASVSMVLSGRARYAKKYYFEYIEQEDFYD